MHELNRRFYKEKIAYIDSLLLNSAEHILPAQRELFIAGLGFNEKGLPIHQSKRLRGAIASLVHEGAGCSRSECINIPTILELIHIASLIVDDIQEDHEERWGNPTLWFKYGKAAAINTAFAMISSVFFLSAQLSIDVRTKISETVNEMLEGQIRDIKADKLYHQRLRGYLRIVSGKTGALLRLAIELGGQHLNGDTRRHLSKWASSLGIAHQIQDDVDDIVCNLTNASLPASNLHYFLNARGEDLNRPKTIELANYLSRKYVKRGKYELARIEAHELRLENLSWIMDELGKRNQWLRGSKGLIWLAN